MPEEAIVILGHFNVEMGLDNKMCCEFNLIHLSIMKILAQLFLWGKKIEQWLRGAFGALTPACAFSLTERTTEAGSTTVHFKSKRLKLASWRVGIAVPCLCLFVGSWFFKATILPNWRKLAPWRNTWIHKTVKVKNYTYRLQLLFK